MFEKRRTVVRWQKGMKRQVPKYDIDTLPEYRLVRVTNAGAS
jgi:hypothetical protein